MRFRPTRFNRHLENLGQQFQYWRAFACCCVSATSGAPDTRCKLCHGKGHVYDAPISASAAQARQEVQARWAQMGTWEAGDLVLSVPHSSPIWHAGEFDRVRMLNADERFSLPLTRDAVNEMLPFAVKALERVFWKVPNSGERVEGGLPTLDARGRPIWGDRAPPPGMTYSITGTRYLEYFIYRDMPGNRNFHNGVPLPKHVVMRKYDLMARGSTL